MALQLGLPDVPARWDQTIRSIHLGADAPAGNAADTPTDEQYHFACDKNLWADQSEDAQAWRKQLPRPHPQSSIQKRFREHLEKQHMSSALVVKPNALELVGKALVS